MEEVVLSFGMVAVAVVVVDTYSRFRVTFEAMCKFFQITSWHLSRGNHKGNIIKKYHRFLNKIQSITEQYHGSYDIFIQNAKTSQYVWNSAPIDDTNAMRSVAAVGK